MITIQTRDGVNTMNTMTSQGLACETPFDHSGPDTIPLKRDTRMFHGPDRLKRGIIPLAGIVLGAGLLLVPLYLNLLLIPFYLNIPGFFYFHETILTFLAILGGCIAGILSGGDDRIGERGLIAGLLSGLLVCSILFIQVFVFPRSVVDKTGLVLIGLLAWGFLSIILYPFGGLLGIILKKIVKRTISRG